MSEVANLFTKEDYENDLALIAADALGLAYSMLKHISPEIVEKHQFPDALERLSQRYREALKNSSSIPIPKKLRPAINRFQGSILDALRPFLDSLSDGPEGTDDEVSKPEEQNDK